ncbi:MAG TPA: FtsX-like permease family protein [Candidatus Limnocylindrales bacterium]
MLTVVAALLAVLTVATAAVLVAGRMAAQSRQLGALKAVGVTPGQATLVVLVEYLVVAVTAAAIGIVVGTALSPLIARSAPSLYGAPQAPPITLPRAAAIAVAALVVLLAAIRPALRGARQSTVRALASAARSPGRPSRLVTARVTMRSCARWAPPPGQTVVSFIVAQLSAGQLACATGIPLGVVLFNTFGGDELTPITLPAFSYVMVALAAPLLYLLIVIAPAARLARRPVAPTLTYE